jgi:hypothetical protein
MTFKFKYWYNGKDPYFLLNILPRDGQNSKISIYNLFGEGVSIIIQINFIKQTFQCFWAVGKNS